MLDTGKSTLARRLEFLYGSMRFLLRCMFARPRQKLVFHGAYSPILWLAVLIPSTHTISILQGSELNVDFHGWRAVLIRLILRRSALVVCRNEAQVAAAVKVAGIEPGKCQIVHWGLAEALFGIPRSSRPDNVVIISPRASQREYNIPVVMGLIRRLKNLGHPLHFIYVKFNATISIDGSGVIDECLENPSQEILWQAMARSDICLSIPDYDGLSNTLLEALALGTYPIISDLSAYEFLRGNSHLATLVQIGVNESQDMDSLVTAVEKVLGDIDLIRRWADERRGYARTEFEEGQGLERLYAEIDA